jgi:hypothetical protein
LLLGSGFFALFDVPAKAVHVDEANPALRSSPAQHVTENRRSMAVFLA